MIIIQIFGCSNPEGGDQNNQSPGISGSVGLPEGADDSLKDLQEQGRFPSSGGGGKMPPLPETPQPGPGSSLNLFPPEIDQDQDNVPNVALVSQPDLPVDNCPNVFNPAQEDENDNGIGDACEGRAALQ